MGPSEITRAQVKKRQPTPRRKPVQPSAASRADAARWAAKATNAAETKYAAKTVPQRRASVQAARNAGGQRTRTQRNILNFHAGRVSPVGQGRGALAKRYSAENGANEILARLNKPTKKTAEPIIQTKLKTDAKQAELLRASIAHAKAPWFNQPAKNAVNFAMTNLQRVSTGIGATVRGRIEDPGSLGKSKKYNFKEGFLHPEEHAEDWDKSVGAAGIHNKYIRGGVALTAAIVTDPTTYVALGTGTLAKEAGAAAAKKALSTGAPMEEAIRAGRAAAKATGEAGQRRGVKIGLRGGPARLTGKRVVMSKPLGGPARQAVVNVGRAAGAKHVGGRAVRDVFEGARKAIMNPNVKPRGWEDYEYEVARQAGTTGRAGERTAQRQSDALKTALAKATHSWSDDDHLAIHKALEANDLSKLKPEHRAVAEELQRTTKMWYAKEPGRAPLGPNAKIGFGDAPTPPAIPNPVTDADIKASRSTVQYAVRKWKDAQDEVGLHKPGTQAHMNATKMASVAQDNVRAARQAHNLRLRQVGTQRKAVRNFTREMDAYNKAPIGYTPRRLNDDVLTGENAVRRPSGRGPTIGSQVSYQGRKHAVALEHMQPEELANYDFNLPRSFGARALEHGRIEAAQEQHRWMAGMADPIHLSDEDARALTGDRERRFFVRDDKGIHPLYNTETGEVKVPELRAALRSGHEVSEINPDKFATIQNLIKGGQRGVEHDPADLLRPAPGEAKEDFLRRAHRTWKWWATAPNPSYHLRNAVGDTFNALIAGTQTGDFLRALRMNQTDFRMKSIEQSLKTPEGTRALEALRNASQRSEHYDGVGGELTDLEVLGLANKYGAINSGIISGELRELQTLGEGPVVEATHVAPVRDAIQRAGDYRENIARLATFRNGMKQGMTPPEAAQYSLRHHIDYSNLSTNEVRFWRYAIPFWTWWSRNLPLQARSIVSNPGLYANVEKARRQSLITAGVDPNIAEQMGDSDQENLPWGTPFTSTSNGKKVPVVAGPGLSYMDLGTIPIPKTDWNTTFKSSGQDLVGRVNPFFKTGGELITGINPYTLSQHEDHNEGKYVTAPSWLPEDFPGVKTKYNKKTGKFEKQVNWRVNSVLNTAPVVSRLGKVSAQEDIAGKPTANMALASWLTGPRYSPVDPRQLQLNALYDQRAQIDSWITEHKGDYKHKSGEPWTGPIGKAFKARSHVQKAINNTSRSMGFKNVRDAGRPRTKTTPMFGAPSGPSGMYNPG